MENLTDKELLSLYNMGNEYRTAAIEIYELREENKLLRKIIKDTRLYSTMTTPYTNADNGRYGPEYENQ